VIAPTALEIVPLAGRAPGLDILDALVESLRADLRIPVSLADPFDPGIIPSSRNGGQLPSNDVVDRLIDRDDQRPALPGRWVLAITDADLCAPGRTFVFGEATLGGAWAVVSTSRLFSPDTAPESRAIRLLKEAIHELGHLAGLDHCAHLHCVMSPSQSVADVDRKGSGFCEGCAVRFIPLAS
jgi:hypothetical protein